MTSESKGMRDSRMAVLAENSSECPQGQASAGKCVPSDTRHSEANAGYNVRSRGNVESRKASQRSGIAAWMESVVMRLRIRYPKDSPPGNGMDSEEPDELKFTSGSVGWGGVGGVIRRLYPEHNGI